MVATGGQHWSSRFAFIMASVGFAVGLGNIWRFPYITGENGGAAFVLVYLVCAFAIGLPVLMAELMIGRRGKGSAPTAVANVATFNNSSRNWKVVGGMGLLAAYCIEVFYAGVVGWVLWYLFKAVVTGFAGMDAVAAEQTFQVVLQSNGGMLFWTLVGLAITGLIIYAGVQDGIERAVTVMMPVMLLLLVGLATYNYFAGGFAEAVRWLFTPDFSKLGWESVLAAIGQAFFSLSVAMGGMMTYGSYLPKDISIARSAMIIVVADTCVALLAGLVIFPAVFSNGLDPAAGPGLIFQTLPVAFAQMPGGHLFAVVFFVILAVAGITSMVGLLETVNSWVEERFGISRHRSSLLVIGSIALLSIISLLSYNVLADFSIGGRDFNALLEDFAELILLPLGGLLIALFAGWVMHSEDSRAELSALGDGGYALWKLLVRFVVPPALLLIFFMGIVA